LIEDWGIGKRASLGGHDSFLGTKEERIGGEEKIKVGDGLKS